MSKVFIFLGTPECGRRKIISQLISEALSGTTTALFIAELERNSEFEKIFEAIPSVEIFSWKFDERGNVEAAETNAENVIFLSDGEDDPVDQIEAFSNLLKKKPSWELARIATIVDCALAENVPESADWFKACIHFSDVVLLANRENVSNLWLKNFQKTYEKECFPCLFVLVKKFRVENPALVLDETPRRMTMIFDEQDPIEDLEFDEKNLPEEPFDLVPEPDKYLETTDSGTRKIAIPKTNEILEKWDEFRSRDAQK